LAYAAGATGRLGIEQAGAAPFGLFVKGCGSFCKQLFRSFEVSCRRINSYQARFALFVE